jgi:microcystin-dependent protein
MISIAFYLTIFLYKTIFTMEPFLGMLALMGFNFAPRGWASCNGQLLSIAQNSALFALLGTTFGGDGQTTFALPDLRGRAAVGQGQAPGLSNYTMGQSGGLETVTLISTQIPAHEHAAAGLTVTMNAATDSGTQSVPGTDGANALGASVGNGGRPAELYVNATPSVNLQGANISGNTAPAGGSQPHENRMPYLALNYVIALEGIFPSRP